MRKLISMIMAAAAAVAVSSCAQEEFDDYRPEPTGETFTYIAEHAADEAAPADGADSKAVMNPETKKSEWIKGDRITVHNGAAGFIFTTQDAGASAQFSYTGDDFSAENGVIAVYPAEEVGKDEEPVINADLAAKKVSVVIPGEQTATAGSYDPEAGIAVAYSTDEHLRFKNATALLKFTVATEGVKSVVFSGLNSEPVCGIADVAFAAEDNTVAGVTLRTEGAGKSVSLTAKDKFEVGKTYYMAIAPQTFSKGFTLSFQFVEDGPLHVAKKHDQSREIRRNVILNVGELAVDLYAGLTNAPPKLNEMKFTVANNPGKILAREFSHKMSSRAYTLTKNDISEKSCDLSHPSGNDDGKVSLYVPYLNDRRLVPTFTIPSGTALMYEGGIIESGMTVVDFCKYKTIRVVNGNKEEAVYQIDFTNTGLPVVVVNQKTGITSTETDSEYQKASNAWYQATGAGWLPKDSEWKMAEDGSDCFMVYNPDGTSALVDKEKKPVDGPILSSTRLRGNVTQQMPKKSFAVKLDSKTGMLGMNPHKRWVLLANWKDRTLLRNEVAFGIAEIFKDTFKDERYEDGTSAAGIGWNPSGQHVELVYNGVHVGNYYLCEQVKIDGNRLDIEDPYEEGAEVKSYTNYGWLLEADDGYDEAYQFTTACYIPFLCKDDATTGLLSDVAAFVRGIEDNLYKGNYEVAFANMDLASFADFLLIQELMMNSELKHPKSCYHYINNGKMYAGPLWDFDWNTLPVSSSDSEEGYSYTSSMLSKAKAYRKKSGYPEKPSDVPTGWFTSEDKNYIWYPMLVKNGEFKDILMQRWAKVAPFIATYVSNLVSTYVGNDDKPTPLVVSDGVNNAMWPVDASSTRRNCFGIGGGYCGDEDYGFSKAVSTLQTTLNTRINGMNSFVGNKTWPTVTYSEE